MAIKNNVNINEQIVSPDRAGRVESSPNSAAGSTPTISTGRFDEAMNSLVEPQQVDHTDVINVPERLTRRESNEVARPAQVDNVQSAVSSMQAESGYGVQPQVQASGLNPSMRAAQPTPAPSMEDDPTQPAASDVAYNELEDNGIDTSLAESYSIGQGTVADQAITAGTSSATTSNEATTTLKLRDIATADEMTLIDPEPRDVGTVFRDVPTKRARKIVEAEQSSSAAALGQEYAYGNNLGDEIIPWPALSMEDVSVGSNVVYAAIQQPTSNVARFLAEKLNLDENEIIAAAMDGDANFAAELSRMLNKVNIPVYSEKHPTVGSGDQHIRYLKMHIGDGMRLHPLAAKIYNADHDGDRMIVKLDDQLIKQMPMAMDRLIDVSGNVAIDADFFIVRQISKQRLDDGLRPILDNLGFNDRDITKIVASLDDADLKEFVRAVRDGAEKIPGSTQTLMADAIDAVWRWNTESLQYDVAQTSAWNDYTRPERPDFIETEADVVLSEWVNDAISRRVALNYQEFKNFFANSLEFIPGKNLEFRIAASFGKMIKLNDYMLIGDKERVSINGEESFYKLYRASADYVYTKIMSNRMHAGEMHEFQKKWMIDKIIHRPDGSIILPTDFRYSDGNINIKEFLSQFDARFEIYAGIVDGSDVNIREDFSVASRRNHQKGAPNRNRMTGFSRDQARRFARIYGDFKMSTLFGGDAKARSYIGESMWEMKLSTFISKGGSIGKIAIPEGMTDAHISKAKDLVIALADIRRQKAAEFNSSLKAAAEAIVPQLRSIRKVLKNWDTNKRDYSAFLDFVNDTLSLLGPDMLSYYELDTADAWVNTRIGREFLNSKTADQVIDRIMIMEVNYRLEKSRRLSRELNDAINSDAEVGPSVAALNARYEQSLAELKSSSPVWALLCSDVSLHGGIFNQYKTRISSHDTPDVILDNKVINYKGWNRLDAASFMDVLRNDSLTWEDKANILTDGIKVFTGENYTRSEIEYQIMLDPSTLYAGNRFAALDGYSQVTENIKELTRKIDGESEATINAINDDVRKGLSTESGRKALSLLLDRIAIDPSSLLSVDTFIYADSINSVMDKESSDTEKGSQQDRINAIVTSVLFQRNGGLYSDLAITDDIYSGRIAEDLFVDNPILLANIIADPSMGITVYNENGSSYVSRATLLGKNVGDEVSMDELADWLIDHPRVAMCLRKHNAIPGRSGKCFLASDEDFCGALDRVSNNTSDWKPAFNALVDQPGFGAVVAAMNSTTGKTSRTKRSSIEKSLERLVVDIIKLSNTHPAIRETILDEIDFGANPYGRDADEKQVEEYENKCERLRENIKKSAELVAHLDQSLRLKRGKPKFDYFKMDDMQTYSSVEDVEQMLSGGKTQSMVGVNGQETRRNGLLPFYASYVPEPCEAEPIEMSIEDLRNNIDEYIGWPTTDGRYVSNALLDDIAGAETVALYDPATCQSVGHCCKNHSVADESTENRSVRQFTAMSILMVTQRMDSTEKNILKFKKQGVDPDNSISKVSIIDILRGKSKLDDWNTIVRPLIEDAYRRSNSIVDARREYAKRMKEAQESLGYDDLSLAQYENIASCLIFEKGDEENKSINICSIEQLSYAIHNRPDIDSLKDCDTVDDLRYILDEAMLSYDPTAPIDIENTLANMKVSQQMNSRPVIRSRASSYERNRAMAFKMYQRFDGVAMIREDVAMTAYSLAKANVDIVKKFPYAYNISKDGKVGRYDGKKHYDLLGVLTDKNGPESMMVNTPAPINLWIIDSSANIDDVNKCLDTAKRYGIMVAMDEDAKNEFGPKIDPDIAANFCVAQNGTYVIPFFDMAINGWDQSTYNPEETFNVGVHRYDPDRITRLVEDTVNEFYYGDAGAVTTSGYVDRAWVRKTGLWQGNTDRIFADVIESGYTKGPVEIVPRSVAQALFVNISDFSQLPMIAYGAMPGSQNRETAEKYFQNALVKYQMKFFDQEATDDFSWSNCEPGDIVGFAVMHAINEAGLAEDIYTPIIPYQYAEGKGCPRSFDASMQVNELTGDIEVLWKHEGGINGRVFKFFEGRNPSNKMMVSDIIAEGDRSLANGHPVDIYVGAASTRSRRMSNLRVDTMFSLAMESRVDPHGYNMAEHDWAFPNDHEIKAALMTGDSSVLTVSRWKQALDASIQFIVDDGSNPDVPMLNAWLTKQCKKAMSIGVNPSIWLASRFGGIPHNLGFRYDAMFENSTTYQDMYQKWLHLMDQSLCPYGVNGDYSKTLFRNDPESGALQMQVPHRLSNGKMYPVWEYVFTSFGFADQHYSGTTKPSIQGKRYSVTGLLNLGYGGKKPTRGMLRNIVSNCMADRTGKIAGGSSFYLDPEDDMTYKD